MKLWKTRKLVIFLLLMYMPVVFGQHTSGGEQSSDSSTNEEAHRLTAGWRFVQANQKFFATGSLSKNPTFLSVFTIEDFRNENIDRNTSVRILTPRESRSFLGFIDLDHNTYDVAAELSGDDLGNVNIAEEYGHDALIGIQSSALSTSAERFILRGSGTVPGPEEEM